MIIAVVRCHSTVNEPAICYNKENEHNIKGGIKASVPASAKISCVSHHNPFLNKREKALCLQLSAETQKWLSVSGVVVRQDKRLLDYTESGKEKATFNASTGWFRNFK
jgi:hypothetical protein